MVMKHAAGPGISAIWSAEANQRVHQVEAGAGEGNRTLVSCLGSKGNTIIRRPLGA
jgi:hypothetical protein